MKPLAAVGRRVAKLADRRPASPRRCHLDYETRSDCDLKLAGVYVYARHPTTTVLCCAYSIDGGSISYWAAASGQPMPTDLKKAMRSPECEMHAWNAQFERLITRDVLKIDIPLERWHCTAALARARGLPGKLESALEFLDKAQSLEAKRYGTQIMLKWCKPLSGGPDAVGQNRYATDPQEYQELLCYCMDDVRSERLIADLLTPLTPAEREDYLLTERINDTGLPIDVPLALAAAKYGDEEKAELNALLRDLTKGTITSTSQHARVKDWLKERLGAELFAKFFSKVMRMRDKDDGSVSEVRKESTDKAARADFLNSEAAKEAVPDVIDLIELVDDAGKASVSKYARMAARATDNGRAQGAYIYAGAVQTKRFSSTGVQMHNLPREMPKDVEGTIDAVLAHRVEGKVMHTLASLLRPTIKAAPGRLLVWGDWSSVEARGMPWLADCQHKLNLYRQGVDVYRENATHIFGTPYGDVSDGQRQIGKVAELSLQFGGAIGALKAMARGYGIGLTDAEAATVVSTWRGANQWAPRFSKGLYAAFMKTVLGTDIRHGLVAYRQIPPLLADTVSIACDLPGGTTLHYHGIGGTVVTNYCLGGINVAPDLSGWDGSPINSYDSDVTFMKALPAGSRVERVWHGLFAENVTQALCAALLRDCLARVDALVLAAGVDAAVIGHTHDELLLDCATADAQWTAGMLWREMTKVPQWLFGFPLGCEVKSGGRYVK